MSASVKVMLSYDYCHFEVSKSTDQVVTDAEIDEMRKDVQRLANKAVSQFKIFKQMEMRRSHRESEKYDMERRVNRIELKPEGERTVEEVAVVKAYHDRNWDEYISSRYDFEDEWDEDEYDDEQ